MADLNWYRNFVAVYRAGSVSAAARSRNLTQPAVSQQLAALESSVGEALFVRTARGMEPTEQGKRLYTQVVESLDRLERVAISLRRDQARARPLRLGVPADFFSSAILPRIAETDLRLQVQFAHGKDSLIPKLEAGTLDVVIDLQRPNMRGIEHLVLRDKHFFLIGVSDLRVPRRSLEVWLMSQTWVSYGAELPLLRRFWNTHLGRKFDAEIGLIVPDLRAVLSAVELGMGLSILPDFLCTASLEAGRVRNLWTGSQVLPPERWIMSYREVDAERPEILQLAKLLTDTD